MFYPQRLHFGRCPRSSKRTTEQQQPWYQHRRCEHHRYQCRYCAMEMSNIRLTGPCLARRPPWAAAFQLFDGPDEQISGLDGIPLPGLGGAPSMRGGLAAERGSAE